MDNDKLGEKPRDEFFIENRRKVHCPLQNNSVNEMATTVKSEKFFKSNKNFGMSVLNNLNKKKRVNMMRATVQVGMDKLDADFVSLPPPAQFEEIDFQEDDILADIQPDTDLVGIGGFDEIYRERKCRYCRRRFMFRETYDEHVNECLEKKFINFIYEINYYLELKTNGTITSNQFIQKMIVALKSNLEMLLKYCDDLVFPHVVTIGVDGGVDGRPTATEGIREEINTRLNKVMNVCKTMFVSSTNTNTDDRSNSTSSSSTPLDYNKVTNSFFSPVPKMCCPICVIDFDDLGTFERHNIEHHYQVQSKSSNEANLSNMKLIELFENQDGLVEGEDFNSNLEKPKIFNRFSTTQPNKVHEKITVMKSLDPLLILLSNFDTQKSVCCTKCDKKFATISHLDIHVQKNHTN